MPAVKVANLSKKFRRRLIPKAPTLKEQLVSIMTQRGQRGEEIFQALSDVSFDVEPGTMLGIIGGNGSGKSTLLKILAGIYRADGGEARCRGRVTSLIELGAGFHPDLTGRENLFINGLLLGLSRTQVRERYDDMVRFSGLEKFMDSPIRTYSSGMYMRLGFAIAAHVEPDVLLVDEILAVGDEAFQHQCLGRINQFRREGKTIIYVSHDLGAVARLSDRVLWLDRGTVRALGDPREVVDGYLEMVEEGEGARLMAEHHRFSVEAMESGGKRWGSGEVRINSVRVFDDEGAERYLYHTGEQISIRLSYEALRRVDDVAFGVGFHRDDGISCYGTNTDIDQVSVGGVEGTGEIRLEVEDLSLLEGSYLLDVAAHRKDGYPYDYHSRAYRIEVRSATKDGGVCRLPHRWVLG